MISFESDYIAGAHPAIIKHLTETNMEILSGYGSDKYCDSAKKKIAAACGCENADVELLVGGTQTNAIVISTMLKDYEGVIAATTGHVSVHEAGAIEYTGHKVITLPHKDGKLRADVVRDYLETFYADESHEHMPIPGMIYISHPTESGTLYTKSELTQLSEVCHAYNMSLYMDGARLGYGLMSHYTDLTLKNIAELCDVFYIGGTKVGALCGEAVVFTKNNKPHHFLTSIKKRGALLAKGRLVGVQFDALFTDNLYFEISKHAIEMADKLKAIIVKHGVKLFTDSPTNQQFVVMENSKLDKLRNEVGFSYWEKYDNTHTVIRLATAWSTTEEELEVLDNALSHLE